MSDLTRLINALPRLQSRIGCPKKYLAIQGSLRLLRALENSEDEIQKASNREFMISYRVYVRENTVWRNK